MEKLGHAVRYLIRLLLYITLVALVLYIIATSFPPPPPGSEATRSFDLGHLLLAIPVIAVIVSITMIEKTEYRSKYAITVEQAPPLPCGSSYDSYYGDNDVGITSVLYMDKDSGKQIEQKYYPIYLNSAEGTTAAALQFPLTLNFQTCPPRIHITVGDIRMEFSDNRQIIHKISDLRAFTIPCDFRSGQKILVCFVMKCRPELAKQLLYTSVTIHMRLTYSAEGNHNVTEYFYLMGGQCVNHLRLVKSVGHFSWLKHYRQDHNTYYTVLPDLFHIWKEHFDRNRVV